MSRYLLDSDVLSALFDQANPSHANTTTQLAGLRNDDAVGLSVLTLCELEYSQWGFSDHDDRQRIVKFIQRCKQEFTLVGMTAATANLYGEMKHQFKLANGSSAKAMRRHNIGLLLAATAITSDCTLD